MRKPTKKAHQAATPMTTGEATVAALIAHGIDTIYALPGVHNDHLFDALFKAGDAMRTVHTRHEQGAAYMALGAALATDKPQAYTVVPGPGLLNSAAALLTAYGMNAPVLGLIGQIAQSSIGRGYGYLHEFAIRLASSPGLPIFPPASASPAKPPRWWRRPCRRWAAAGAARRCSNARSTYGGAALPWRRSRRPPRQPKLRSMTMQSATPPSASGRRSGR